MSSFQVPKPYKPPSSNMKTEKVEKFSSSPEYSNVKKASITLKKSAVSAKISQFSKPEEKPTMTKKPWNKKVEHSKPTTPPSKSSTITEVTRNSNGTLNKDIKHNQLKSNGSQTKIKPPIGLVLNKVKPPSP